MVQPLPKSPEDGDPLPPSQAHPHPESACDPTLGAGQDAPWRTQGAQSPPRLISNRPGDFGLSRLPLCPLRHRAHPLCLLRRLGARVINESV